MMLFKDQRRGLAIYTTIVISEDINILPSTHMESNHHFPLQFQRTKNKKNRSYITSCFPLIFIFNLFIIF